MKYILLDHKTKLTICIFIQNINEREDVFAPLIAINKNNSPIRPSIYSNPSNVLLTKLYINNFNEHFTCNLLGLTVPHHPAIHPSILPSIQFVQRIILELQNREKPFHSTRKFAFTFPFVYQNTLLEKHFVCRGVNLQLVFPCFCSLRHFSNSKLAACE